MDAHIVQLAMEAILRQFNSHFEECEYGLSGLSWDIRIVHAASCNTAQSLKRIEWIKPLWLRPF